MNEINVNRDNHNIKKEPSLIVHGRTQDETKTLEVCCPESAKVKEPYVGLNRHTAPHPQTHGHRYNK